MIRTSIWAIGWMLVAGSVSGLAQDSNEFIVFRTTWVPSKICNGDLAIPVSLTELALNPQDWVDKCVSVRGYPGGFALFSDPDEARRRGASWARDLKDRRIGLYGKDGANGPSRDGDDGAVLAVGKVGRCEDLSGNYDMVSNYCHSASGPYIALVADE